MATKKKTSSKKKTSAKKSTTTVKNLVIVESPTKTKSISKYLGKDYEVTSSKGHVIDLPKSDLGINVENNYAPEYTPMHGKKTVIKDLQKLAKNAETIYLATDLDREGEAIAWHVVSALEGLDENGNVNDNDRFKRVVFSEITKGAIQKAFENPRGFDYNLIDAYQARRVLDRLVGYKLSPLLWKKIQYGLSAGRVQSVAMRLIVEREMERKAFTSTPYYRIFANVKQGENFEPELDKIDEQSVEQKTKMQLFAGDYSYTSTILDSTERVEEHSKILEKAKQLKVTNVTGKERSRKPNPPFTTASLQRAGQTYLYTSAKNTMRMAQRLYEEGYITYHRTDSMNLSQDFVDNTRSFLKDEYGNDYVPEKPRHYDASESAQEAHEAIRPTNVLDFDTNVKKVKDDLGDKESQLFKLIWERAVASQMTDALYRYDTIVLEPNEELDHSYIFTAKGSVILFEGHLKVYGKRGEDTILPDLQIDDVVDVNEYFSTDHETSPPPRYTEASLIKELESHSIGRPSTYAPTIDTLMARDYVIKEGSAFVPEDIGIAVTKLLIDHFPTIVDLDFTAEMEQDLDHVAHGKEDWHEIIDEFYQPFEKTLDEKEETIDREDYKVLEELDEKCPDCQHNLQLKLGKYGKFYSCSNFPDCKFAKPYLETIDMDCPDCKDGQIIVKRTRRGKKFFGCSNYPNCDWASWNDPRNEDNKKEEEESK